MKLVGDKKNMFVGRKETLLIVVLIVVIVLVLVIFLTPVFSWITAACHNLRSSPSVTTPVPTATLSTVPASPASPVVTPSTSPVPASTPASPKTMVFTEAELQKEFTGLAQMLNGSGQVKVDSLTVKLEQDSMLISAQGEVLGNKVQMDNMVVTFRGRTVSAQGTIKALGYEPALTLVFDITTTNGRPAITITEFNAGSIGILLNMIGFSREKIQNYINDGIVSRGLKLPFDLQGINISGGKLIVAYQ